MSENQRDLFDNNKRICLDEEYYENQEIEFVNINNTVRSFSASLTSSRMQCNFRGALAQLPSSIALPTSERKVLFSLV